MYVYTFTRWHLEVYVCVHIYIYLYINMYIYIRIYIYTCMCIYTYIHTSIFLCAFAWMCSGVSCECVCVELYARLFVWSLFSRLRVNNWAELNCVYECNDVMSVFATCTRAVHTHEYTRIHTAPTMLRKCITSFESRWEGVVCITSRCSGCCCSFVLSFVRKQKTFEP